MNPSILTELSASCTFAKVFKAIDQNNRIHTPTYRGMLGYATAKHDGWRWQSGWFPNHKATTTLAQKQEIDMVCAALTENNAFYCVAILREFCTMHPEAGVGMGAMKEYNFFYEGTYCNFWIRAIPRFGVCNLYIHAFDSEFKRTPF